MQPGAPARPGPAAAAEAHAGAAQSFVARWEDPRLAHSADRTVTCGALLGLLPLQQRHSLVAAVIGSRWEDFNTCQAIAGLSQGLAHLSAAQRERLVSAVAGLDRTAVSIHVARAIRGLAGHGATTTPL
jgi:hypothetical protein